MAVFEYNAVDLDSSSASGTVVADTPRQARDLLREKGLTVTRIEELKSKAASRFRSSSGKRGQAEVVSFIRELSTLLRAGIPLLSATQTLAEQHHGRFRAVIQDLSDQIASGTNLAEAMEQHPEYFDSLCTSIVHVGENTGSLESSLAQLAGFKEKAQRLRSKVTTALVYPLVVCTIGVAVTIFLMTFVVPNLLSTLEQSGKQLPAVTRFIKGCSDLVLNWWWAMLIGGVGLLVTIRAILKTHWGRLVFDRLSLKLPLFGDLLSKEITARMAVVLSALLRSGLPFVQAVRITRGTMKNMVFRKGMDDYEIAISAGSDVAAPLRASGIFSPMVVQMLTVGQQSGELEEMLEQLADSYQQEVDTATQRLTALLEPLLIVLLAIMIGFIAFATILPILEMSNVL